jgi:hypothetical protein
MGRQEDDGKDEIYEGGRIIPIIDVRHMCADDV